MLRKYKILSNHFFHIALGMALLSALFITSTLSSGDDDLQYFKFAQTIVLTHHIDWSIPGFHGSDFFVALLFAITHSTVSVQLINIFCAILIIPVLYCAVTNLFKDKTLGLFAIYAYLLMPITYTSALRGFNFTPMIFFSLLGIWLLTIKSRFSFLIGIAYIIKPFSIAWAPLFLYQKKIKQFLFSLIFPIIYIIAEYTQTHHIIIGVHKDYTIHSLFSVNRFLFNIVYGIQNYFSVHGFSPINHAYLDDMPHITPLITLFAGYGVIYYKKIYKNDLGLFVTLFSCALIAYIIPISFYHFDYWYLTIFNFSLVFLALRPIQLHTELVPAISGLSFFEFYYTLIAHPQYFPSILSKFFLFSIWFAIVITSILYVYSQQSKSNN